MTRSAMGIPEIMLGLEKLEDVHRIIWLTVRDVEADSGDGGCSGEGYTTPQARQAKDEAQCTRQPD